MHTDPVLQTDPLRAVYDDIIGWAGDRLGLEGAELLEYGVGKRGFAEFYSASCKRVVALDIENYGRLHAGKPYEFKRYKGDRIPEDDLSFDIVASHSVLEHVLDIEASLAEIDRILKVRGRAFLTVSPLYYSSWGSHVRVDGQRLDDWSHLRPDADHYLTAIPFAGAGPGGHHLNKMTMADFLHAVGNQPWDIIALKRTYERKAPPEGLVPMAGTPLDLISKGFQLLARKTHAKPTVG